MKKTVFVLLLVALLLSLALPVAAMAGMGADDPCNHGTTQGNAQCLPGTPPGLEGKIGPGNGHGKSGDNWYEPTP
jgi:hypothetical protein